MGGTLIGPGDHQALRVTGETCVCVCVSGGVVCASPFLPSSSLVALPLICITAPSQYAVYALVSETRAGIPVSGST